LSSAKEIPAELLRELTGCHFAFFFFVFYVEFFDKVGCHVRHKKIMSETPLGRLFRPDDPEAIEWANQQVRITRSDPVP